MSNEDIAVTAINLLTSGVEYKNKEKILLAYDMVENEYFSWDNLDALSGEWDDLIDEANEIIYA